MKLSECPLHQLEKGLSGLIPLINEFPKINKNDVLNAVIILEEKKS